MDLVNDLGLAGVVTALLNCRGSHNQIAVIDPGHERLAQPQRTNTVPTRPSPAEVGDLGHDTIGIT